MVRGIPNISVHALAYPTVQSGKMSLPVDSSSLIYSHFEHVSGIAAPQGTHGLPISKLKLLNVLIEHLNQAGKEASSSGQTLFAGEKSARQIDALIEQYSSQIRQTEAASAAMPYIPSPGMQSGALFSIAI